MRYVWQWLMIVVIALGLSACNSDGDGGEKDTTPPVIHLLGDNPMRLTVGDAFTDPGAVVTDNVDANRTIKGSGSVDTAKAGTYTLIYTAKDAAGNEAKAVKRTVEVQEAPNKPPTAKATASPTTAAEGEAITFDGSGSRDSDGSITGYEWKEGSSILSRDERFTRTDLSVGAHTVTLTVTDDDGARATDRVTVTVTAPAATGQLKKTGQTKSYDKDGNEVTDSSIKDDGFYQKGVDPDYTRDDTKKIVTDHVTGLMWQDDANASSVTKPWLTQANYDKCTGSNGQTQDDAACEDTSGDTAATYCANLTLGGYTDWRLPTRKELVGLSDYGRYDPAISPVFTHTASGSYWSSSTNEGYHDDAWRVYFYSGGQYYGGKDYSLYVRCVRAGQ